MIKDKELIIFCDESDKTGKFYSNFYGGVMVGSSSYQKITNALNETKSELNLFGEVKWEKVTERYLLKYITLIDRFFNFVFSGDLKVRIMFTQNARRAKGLKIHHIEEEYFILYYHFLKNAFGLGDIPYSDNEKNLRIYLDQFPQQKKEKIEKFRGYLAGGIQNNHRIRKSNIVIKKENITEVRSHDHVLLQCLDIVLGSMSFRLNDKHLIIPKGKRIRGKKTRAKEKLYKFILKRIREIRLNFNIGMSSKIKKYSERFTEPYLHWCFIPRVHEFDDSKTKKSAKKNSPICPTSVPDA